MGEGNTTMIVAQYDHHRAGVIQALPVADWPAPSAMTAMTDWIAVTLRAGLLVGYVVDTRADGGGEPSAETPPSEDPSPFEAYDRAGQYITSTHSIHGALLAIGNRA
jgi:hypothetical protein